MRYVLGVFSLLSLCLSSCAHYQVRVDQAVFLMQTNPNEADDVFESKAKKKNSSQAAYLLDYATVLQFQNRFAESNKYFLKAESLQKSKDFTQVSNVAKDILVSSDSDFYKPSELESHLNNTMLHFNFLMLRNWSAALVESRKLSDRSKRKRKGVNPASLYFSGLSWEKSGQYENAFIDYREAYKLSPSPIIARSTLHMAKKSGLEDTLPSRFLKVATGSPKPVELVILYQQGFAVRKSTPAKEVNNGGVHIDNMHLEFQPIQSQIKQIEVEIRGGKSARSELLFDVSRHIIEQQKKNAVKTSLKRFGKVAVRSALWYQVFGDAGAFFAGLFYQPDTRHWGLLPATFQVVRVGLPKKATFSYRIKELEGGIVRRVHPWRVAKLEKNSSMHIDFFRSVF